MHEYGLAQEIAEQVAAEAERVGAHRLARLDVEVGGLANLRPDLLVIWLRETLPESLASGSRLHVHRERLRVICRRCGHRERLDPEDDTAVAIFRARCQGCAQCGCEEVKVDGTAGCRICQVKFRD